MKTMMFAAALSTVLVSGGLVGSAPAEAATMNCSVPNNVVCTVTSATGVRSIKVFSNAGFGTVAVVDKSYRNCPRSVKVSWDSAYQSSGTQIVECSGVSGLKLR